MTTRSFPLTTIRSPRMAPLNRRRFNQLKPSRSNSQQREPVNPMQVCRLQAVFYLPCVMKIIWLTAMFIKNFPLALHQSALR